MADDRKLNRTSTLTIPFPTKREADIAYNVLRIDPEPKRGGVKKDLKLETNTLTINLTAPDARQLRVALGSVIDNLMLVTETMDRFGPPKSEEYSYY